MVNKSESEVPNMEVPSMDTPMVSEPAAEMVQNRQQGGGEFSTPPMSSSSDHLEQIKARLKQQTLGKPSIGASAPLDTIPSSPPPVSKQTIQTPATPVDTVLEQHENAVVELPEVITAPLASSSEEGGGRKFEEMPTDGIEEWLALIEKLPLKGMAAEVARNSVLIALSATKMTVSIDPEQNYSRQTMALEQFLEAVKQHFGLDFELEFVSAKAHFTPVKYEKQQAQIRQQKAEKSIQQDPSVQALTQTLGLEVVQNSIQSI
ncbi:hypothetical protein MNBD_GAMMA04-2110 [hydrothermal vent metagenome]|uniref:DNA polymerase III tau subunit domain-containing protein n=1 Tax=hydrothermal vent metagenome TaxID=652676 RepID=A0A3B0WJT5_9ZZZZ